MQHFARQVYAWLGAVTFVFSLLYFLYFYLFKLDQPAEPGGLRALTFDVAMFSIFALHHSVMARTGAKRWISRLIPAQLERSTYVWISSLLFLVVCAGWRPIGGVLYDIHGWASVPFRAVQIASIVLILRAAAVLDVLDLAGVRQIQGSAPTAPLHTSGVYGLVRHPIYLGWALLVFGAPRMTVDRAVFATVSTAYLALAVPFEERSLTESFGDGYRRYISQVRWKIVPWVY
jgi:methanethiol S-methyltransferase